MTGERKTSNVARLANLPDECGHPSYPENIGRRRSTANKAYEEDKTARPRTSEMPHALVSEKESSRRRDYRGEKKEEKRREKEDEEKESPVGEKKWPHGRKRKALG